LKKVPPPMTALNSLVHHCQQLDITSVYWNIKSRFLNLLRI